MSNRQYEITTKGVRPRQQVFAAKSLNEGDQSMLGFTVEKNLSGGMGAVYVLRGPVADKRYVLKTFADSAAQTNELAARFLNEIEVVLSLEDHENIVKGDIVLTWDDAPCVLLDYFDGQTLRAILDEGNIGLPEALRFALQLCHGMVYVGDTRRIVHRDIKPENMLIDRNGLLKIVDFGLAKVALTGTLQDAARLATPITPHGVPLPPTDWRVTKLRHVIGTPDYSAPELFERPDNATVRSDIYSTGLVFAEMLTGTRIRGELSLTQKREGVHDWALANRHLAKNGVSEPLRGIVRQCLEQNPDRRFQSFGALRAAIDTEFVRISGYGLRSGVIRPRSAADSANLAVSLAKFGRHEEAATLCRRALETEPENTACLTQLANCQVALNRLDEARATAERACSAAADSLSQVLAWSCKANLFRHMGDETKVIECLERALDANPESAETWALKGDALRRLERVREAIACFQQSLVLDDTNHSVWAVLGQQHRSLEDYANANACFKRALELQPRTTPLVIEQALCLALLGKRHEAHEMLFALYAEHPQDSSVRDALSVVSTANDQRWYELQALMSAGQFEEAIRLADTMGETHAGVADVSALTGHCTEHLGRYSDALESYDRSLRVKSGDEIVHVNRANVLDKMGRSEEALRSYDSILALRPTSVAALVNKAACLLSLRRKTEAVECCERAIQVAPDSYMSWRLLGIVLCECDKYEAARACLQNALRLEGRDVAAWAALGNCELNLGLFEEALESLAQTLRLEPDSWRNWANVALALQSMERKREAIVYLEQAALQAKTDPELWARLGGSVMECVIQPDGAINVELLHDAARYMEAACLHDPRGRFTSLRAHAHQMISELWRHTLARAVRMAASGQAEKALPILKKEESRFRSSGKELMRALVLTNQAVLLAQGTGEYAKARTRAEQALDIARRIAPAEVTQIIERVLESLSATGR